MDVMRIIEEAIAARTFPGCVIGISHGGARRVLPSGRETYDRAAPPITAGSVYDLASVTKSVVTATLALQLIDERRLALDDAVTMHLPRFAGADVRIRHLLTYTLGNTIPLSRLCDAGPDALIAAICTETRASPGTVFSYSNAPALLLGLVVESVLGTSLASAAQERIFDPLGMRSATFAPHNAVPTAEGVRGVVHDESARVFARAGRAAGHAGLFADAPDLLAFLEDALRRKDARVMTNQIPGIGLCGLGWELDQPWMGQMRSPRTFGKTGFTGTSVLADPERDLAIVILSNRTYPQRPPDQSAIMSFRASVHDILRSI